MDVIRCCTNKKNLRYYIKKVAYVDRLKILHNYKIASACPKHAGVLMFATDDRVFTNLEEAELWMINDLLSN